MDSHVTVNAHDFIAMGTAAIEATTRQEDLPVLQAVNIFRTGDSLVFEATDRHLAIRTRVSVLNAPESSAMGSTLVNGAVLKGALMKVKGLKLGKGDVVAIERGQESNGDSVTLYANGWSTTLDIVKESYPKLAGLFQGAHTAESAGVFGVGHDYMARISRVGKLVGKNEPVILSPHENPCKPIRFTVGENVAGMLMPVRIHDGGDAEMSLPEWAKVAPLEYKEMANAA